MVRVWTASDLVRVAAGTLDLAATRRQAALELGSLPRPSDLAVYRVLGARQVGQAVLTARTGWRALGAVVDLLHLASMVPVLLASRRWRRAAAVQIGFAVLMLTLAGREARPGSPS